MALGLRHVYAVFQPVHLSRGEELGQMFTKHWRLQQFSGVLLYITVKNEKLIECAHTAKYAALRPWAYAYVMESGGKMLQVRQLHIEDMQPYAVEIVEQFVKVTRICIERVRRHATLQFEVAQIAFSNILYVFFGLFHYFFVILWQNYEKK